MIHYFVTILTSCLAHIIANNLLAFTPSLLLMHARPSASPPAVVDLHPVPCVDAGTSSDSNVGRPVVKVEAVVTVDDVVALGRVACSREREEGTRRQVENA